jgi:hypothetical protein
MIEHGGQHLDELTIAIGTLSKLGADLSQARRLVPVLEGRARSMGLSAGSGEEARRAAQCARLRFDVVSNLGQMVCVRRLIRRVWPEF